MKKIHYYATFIICLTLWTTNINAQQNPYESLGIETKVLTLSNGKYQEFFPNDTLQPIGNVMVNTITGEIHGFLEVDTMYAEWSLEPEVMSRFLSIDPLAAKFPEWSPYHYAGNNPILNIDVDGMFKFPAHLAQKYPAFASYLQNNVQEVLNSDAIMNSLQTNGGFDRATIENDLQWGDGPTVDIRKLGGENLTAFGYYDGRQPDGSFKLSLDEDMLGNFEKAFSNDKISDDVKQGLLLGVVSTLLHEYTHHGTGGSTFEDEEMGHKFELDAYGFYVQPDDINQLMQILKLKTTGELVNPSNHREVLEERPNDIDPSVLPTLPDND